MKPFAQLIFVTALAAVLALALPPEARGEEFINRREQARQAFRATPQGLYGHYCAPCHGEDAQGAGRLWANDLPVRPADLTALGADKESVLAVIRDGSAAQGKSNLCPPWGRTLSPDDVERLAQYVVSLQDQASQPATAPAASPEPLREPFPWLLLAVALGEAVLLGWLLRRKKEVSDVVP